MRVKVRYERSQDDGPEAKDILDNKKKIRCPWLKKPRMKHNVSKSWGNVKSFKNVAMLSSKV